MHQFPPENVRFMRPFLTQHHIPGHRCPKQTRDVFRPERRFDVQDKQAHDYVVWEVPSVTNLLAVAQFNKRSMLLSEFIDMHDYQVGCWTSSPSVGFKLALSSAFN